MNGPGADPSAVTGLVIMTDLWEVWQPHLNSPQVSSYSLGPTKVGSTGQVWPFTQFRTSLDDPCWGLFQVMKRYCRWSDHFKVILYIKGVIFRREVALLQTHSLLSSFKIPISIKFITVVHFSIVVDFRPHACPHEWSKIYGNLIVSFVFCAVICHELSCWLLSLL